MTPGKCKFNLVDTPALRMRACAHLRAPPSAKPPRAYAHARTRKCERPFMARSPGCAAAAVFFNWILFVRMFRICVLLNKSKTFPDRKFPSERPTLKTYASFRSGRALPSARGFTDFNHLQTSRRCLQVLRTSGIASVSMRTHFQVNSDFRRGISPEGGFLLRNSTLSWGCGWGVRPPSE